MDKAMQAGDRCVRIVPGFIDHSTNVHAVAWRNSDGSHCPAIEKPPRDRSEPDRRYINMARVDADLLERRFQYGPPPLQDLEESAFSKEQSPG